MTTIKYEITVNESETYVSAEEWNETYDTLEQALARVEDIKKKNSSRSMNDRNYSLEVVGGTEGIRKVPIDKYTQMW